MSDSEVLQNLLTATAEKDEIKVKDYLRTLSVNTELDSVTFIIDLLHFQNTEIINSTAELVAELTKLESNRKVCTNEELIKDLFNQLENPETVLQTVRALGNICYENKEACNIIEKIGTNKLLSILIDDTHRADNSVTTKVSGLYVNLFNMNENIIKTSLKDGILIALEKIIEKYTDEFDENRQLLTFIVSLINNSEHYLDELGIPFTTSLCTVLLNLFKESTSPELSVACLEVFQAQCEQEEIKTLLAKGAICEFLFELIEAHKDLVNDEDSRSVLKMACDFIVLILTGDECMNMLYNRGHGTVYKNMVTWLDSEDIDLLTTGVLAIGNFARNEDNCIEMAGNGISKKLLDILKRYNTSTKMEDVKIQHALLSTLKNLVIPMSNKPVILNQGLIEVIYPMIQIDSYLVVFKLLGTFRLAIVGQESTALDLISRKELIEKLVFWCYHSDHLGVRGEVPRLLAWLIKQCHSFTPFKLLLEIPDSIKCIVEMISSNHALMQNEAFYALTLLCKGCSGNTESDKKNTLIKILIDANIGKNLYFILSKYVDKMDKPTIENLALLLDELVTSEEICKHFKDVDLITQLIRIFNNQNVCKIAILHKIESLVSNN